MVFLAACVKEPNIDTRMTCPDGTTSMILSTRSRDLADAIRHADAIKRRYNTGDKNTVIKLRDKRSFFIKLSPEEAMKCVLEERLSPGNSGAPLQ